VFLCTRTSGGDRPSARHRRRWHRGDGRSVSWARRSVPQLHQQRRSSASARSAGVVGSGGHV